MTTGSTPFPLGVYVGNPNNADASDEATFQADFGNFVTTMGATPTYFDTYIDYTQPVSSWVSNTAWAASSSADTTDTAGMIPVIALPMWSNASGSMSVDQQLQAFATGQYDGTLEQMVDQWASNGFKTQIWRPGWEMNLSGPTGVGTDAASEGVWVAAFQHIYTVLHAEAAKDGVTLQVVWNPGVTNYSNGEATTNLYPGNNYVDIVGADVYSDISPYSDGTSLPTYHDWDTGGEDTSVAQFIADPINREHYWSYPAATEWSLDSSDGHSQSLTSLIQFAEAQGKPFAMPETGAGNSDAGTDVQDDAAFPTWLAQQLKTAEAAGENVDFVNIWDSNGGGNYEFSNSSDDKPQEAAAWAAAFGGQTATLGTLTLNLAEDAYLGNAEFTVSIDGTQIGGVMQVTALNSQGPSEAFTYADTLPSGMHDIAISFINDAYGGSPSLDRNLYVTGISYNGVSPSQDTASLDKNGTDNFYMAVPATSTSTAAPVTSVPPTLVVGAGADLLSLSIAEDFYLGNAQFTVSVDGEQIGGVMTASAINDTGSTQAMDILGNLQAGAHTVSVNFLNDAWGGSASTDRNLYITGASFNGTPVAGASLALWSDGAQSIGFSKPATTTPGPTQTLSPGIITVNLSEDAYQGNAQFTVSIDGTQLGGAQQVSALHSLGASQAFTFEGAFAAGTHDIAISFLNGASSTASSSGHNLYVDGISYNTTAQAGSTASMMSTSADHFSFVVPSTATG